jgi:hypothetical protein
MSWLNVKVNDDIDEDSWSGWVWFNGITVRLDGTPVMPEEIREIMSDLAGVLVHLESEQDGAQT